MVIVHLAHGLAQSGVAYLQGAVAHGETVKQHVVTSGIQIPYREQ